MTACADIVVVNWNAGALLAECAASIVSHPQGVGLATLVDNGSTDSSADFAPAPPVEIMKTGENLGFAGGCNLGAARGTSPYILFLNPDARLHHGGLPRALAFMADPANADVGICGVKLLDENGAVQRHACRFPTPRSYVGQATGLSKIFPRVFPPHFLSEFDHLSTRDVDQVIGAYFLVRRSLFEDLDGFDERFFVYAEELDFSLRARRHGFRTVYLHDATATHIGEGTTSRVKARRLFYNSRSRLLYASKHFGGGGAFVAGLSLLAIEPLARLGRAVLRQSGAELVDTVNGYRMLYRDLPAIRRTAATMRRGGSHASRSSKIHPTGRRGKPIDEKAASKGSRNAAAE